MSALTDAIMSNVIADMGTQNDDVRVTRAAIDTYVKKGKAGLATTVTASIMDVDKALTSVKSRDKVDDDTVTALQSVMQFLPKILSE